MPDSVPTLGELNRNIVGLRHDLAETRREMSRLHELETRVALNRRDLDDVAADVGKLNESVTWVVRLVVTAVLVAILSLVVGAVGPPTTL